MAESYNSTTGLLGPAIDDAILKGSTSLQPESINTLAKLNALITDATLLTDSAFAAVATTGAYSDLSGKPTLGTAAATDASAYATAAQGAAADAALPASGGVLGAYSETGQTLAVVDDGDGTYSLTIPLDNHINDVTLTNDVDLLTSDAPTPPTIGGAVLYLTQSTPASVVTTPATWLWPDSTAEAFDTDGAVYRLTLYTDPGGNIHADAELRGAAE